MSLDSFMSFLAIIVAVKPVLAEHFIIDQLAKCLAWAKVAKQSDLNGIIEPYLVLTGMKNAVAGFLCIPGI